MVNLNAVETYPAVSMHTCFYYYCWECIDCLTGISLVTFGFYHDSLNAVNSAKLLHSSCVILFSRCCALNVPIMLMFTGFMKRFLPPPSEVWRKVIISICLSVHMGRGGVLQCLVGPSEPLIPCPFWWVPSLSSQVPSKPVVPCPFWKGGTPDLGYPLPAPARTGIPGTAVSLLRFHTGGLSCCVAVSPIGSKEIVRTTSFVMGKC